MPVGGGLWNASSLSGVPWFTICLRRWSWITWWKNCAAYRAPVALCAAGVAATPLAANPGVQKFVYWLTTAEVRGANPAAVAQAAVEAAGYTNKLAWKVTVEAMLRNLGGELT
jgi:hypothetical protein